jgi:hypothetical protein
MVQVQTTTKVPGRTVIVALSVIAVASLLFHQSNLSITYWGNLQSLKGQQGLAALPGLKHMMSIDEDGWNRSYLISDKRHVIDAHRHRKLISPRTITRTL